MSEAEKKATPEYTEEELAQMGPVKRWIKTHPNIWEFILFNILSNVSTIARFVVTWIGTTTHASQSRQPTRGPQPSASARARRTAPPQPHPRTSRRTASTTPMSVMPLVMMPMARRGMFQMNRTLMSEAPLFSMARTRDRRTSHTIQRMPERPWLRSRKHMFRLMR